MNYQIVLNYLVIFFKIIALFIIKVYNKNEERKEI